MCAASYIYTNITIHPETVRQIQRVIAREKERETSEKEMQRMATGESSVWALLIFAIIH